MSSLLLLFRKWKLIKEKGKQEQLMKNIQLLSFMYIKLRRTLKMRNRRQLQNLNFHVFKML